MRKLEQGGILADIDPFMYGASWLWQSRSSGVIDTPEGRADYAIFDPDAFTADLPYGTYHPGTAELVLRGASSPLVDDDGLLCACPTNYWDSWDRTDRGFDKIWNSEITRTDQTTVQMLDPTAIAGHSVGTTPLFTNVHTAESGIAKLELSSSSYKRMLQVFVRMSDGSSPESSVRITAFDTDGTDLPSYFGSTRFAQLPGSDWWVVWNAHSITGVNHYVGIMLAAGAAVYIEAPYWWSVGSGNTEVPFLKVPFTSGTSGTCGDSFVKLSSFAQPADPPSANDYEPYVENGYLAGVIALPWIESDDPSIPSAVAVEWAVDTSNFIRIGFSSTYQVPYVWMKSVGVTQAYHLFPGGWSRFEPIPFCWSWSTERGGTTSYIFAVDGVAIEVEVNGSMPSGTPPYVYLGRDVSGGQAFDGFVHAVLCGRLPLGRSECRVMSSWIKRYAAWRIE
jgi:hypothetical protein